LAIDGDEMKSYLEQYTTVVDLIVMMDQVQGWSCGFGFAKHFDEPTRFSYDLLNDGPYQITAKNLQTQFSLDDNHVDQFKY